MVDLKYKLKRNLKHYCGELLLRTSGAYANQSFVSLCVSVKDRLDHLQKTILLNLANNREYRNCELLLLNYSCPNLETEKWIKDALGAEIATGRVNYYYYPDSTTFDRSHARNLAFRLSKGDIICNIDADNFTGVGFAAYVSAVLSNDNTFLCGPRDGRGLGGRICVKRKDWEFVGGFDERFKGYGPEDRDLTNRLCLAGLDKKIILNEGFCKSIAHSNELRMRHHDGVFRKEYENIAKQNMETRTINPNGASFGRGRVMKNFSKWIDV